MFFPLHHFCLLLSLPCPSPLLPIPPLTPPLLLLQAQTYLVKYGKRLMTEEPEYTSQVITSLCLGHWRQDTPSGQPAKRARPEDFIHIFVNQTEHLVTFLASSVEVGICWGSVCARAHLHVWPASLTPTLPSPPEHPRLQSSGVQHSAGGVPQ